MALKNLSILSSLTFFAMGASGGGAKKAEEPAKPARSSSDLQLLVAFKDESVAASRADVFKKFSAKEIEKVGSTPLYLIELPEGSDLKKTQAEIAKEPGVRYAEPNIKMKIFKQ